MKTRMLILLLGLLIAGPVGVVEGRGDKKGAKYGRRGPTPRHAMRQLDLDENQRQQIRQIVEENRAAMKKLLEQKNDKIRAVLNDEQKAKFDKTVAEMKERRGKGRAGRHDGDRKKHGRRGPALRHVLRELDLTKDQREQTRPIIEENRKAMRSSSSRTRTRSQRCGSR